ncbi:Thioredoxin-like oxidoreductase [Staphylococcus aureus]|uniref:Thioredoxin-like oxidoreductase n=1 Tax=Staphylococcus aureus TaxID=1280 RepID=A0A380E5V0_STAAU|nr:Thioredoxin-like oxidoreductase [Staphylococcus aureus]
MFSKKSIRNVVKPLLKYAHNRGIYTQMNSNLTLPQDRYLDIAEYIDVMHISHNWGTTDESQMLALAHEEATTVKS